MSYESYETIPSRLRPGVSYTVNRMSFARRVDLMRRVKELAPRLEFHQAGKAQQDQLEARMLSADIDRLYLDWGLTGIEGLDIDGVPATPRSLVDAGPEELFYEALGYVKQASRLSEQETKN